MSAKALIGGLVLGLALGAGGLYGVERFVLTPPPCDDRCGEGTVCEGDLCLVDAPEVEAEAEVEDQAPQKKRRRRKGRGGKAKGEGEVAGGGPAVDDDSHVPGFDPKHDQTVGMSDGTGRLSDGQVDAELRKLDKAFQRCVREANDRVSELGTGKVSLKFGVDGKGRVTGVNVSAPGNLKDAGLVPCVRKAIHAHKFPAYDGPETRVSSSFSVD